MHIYLSHRDNYLVVFLFVLDTVKHNKYYYATMLCGKVSLLAHLKLRIFTTKTLCSIYKYSF